MSNIIMLLLGVQLIFLPNISDKCGNFSNIQGCYDISGNIIYIAEDAAQDESVLYHELGHALFYGNAEARRLVSLSSTAQSSEEKIEEEVADSFAEFFTRPEELEKENPQLYEYFRDCVGVLNYFYENL